MKWFRFYHDAIEDPKVQRLPGDLFKFWVNTLCLASRSEERGLVTLDVEAIAFATRTTDDEAQAMIAELVRRDLLEEVVEGLAVHNWNNRQFKSDNVAERVQKHRSNAGSDEGETLQETLHPSVNTDNRVTDTESEENIGADEPKTTEKRKPKSRPADPNQPMPRNGPAQTLVAVLYEDILEMGRPTAYNQVVGQAQTLVNAGCTESEMREIVAWLQADPYWAPKGVTMGTVLKQRDQFRSPKKHPNNMTTLAAPRRPDERVGKDGLTDSERGWREDPGHKGWSAAEMMRMAIAMERADNERNSA